MTKNYVTPGNRPKYDAKYKAKVLKACKKHSVREVAEQFEVSQPTIYKWLKESDVVIQRKHTNVALKTSVSESKLFADMISANVQILSQVLKQLRKAG